MKILSTLVLLAALAVPVRGQILERVLVKVNGDIFTQTELEERQTEAIRKRIGVDLKPEVAGNTAELKKAIDEVTPELLVNAIDEILMLQMGKEKGYKLTDDQFKDWLEKMRKDNNLQDDQKFFSALKQEGMTVDDLRKNIEKSFMVNQVQRDEVGSKLSITEEEARQVLPRAQRRVRRARERDAARDPHRSADDDQGRAGGDERGERRRGRAEGRGRARADPGGRGFRQGGGRGLGVPVEGQRRPDRPDQPVGGLAERCSRRSQKMKPGEVTSPIRTARGFQILKLETLKAAAIQPFESVRDLVADRVHDARQQAEVRKFLARVRGQAIIEWKNDELKKMYESQVAFESARGGL